MHKAVFEGRLKYSHAYQDTLMKMRFILQHNFLLQSTPFFQWCRSA